MWKEVKCLDVVTSTNDIYKYDDVAINECEFGKLKIKSSDVTTVYIISNLRRYTYIEKEN